MLILIVIMSNYIAVENSETNETAFKITAGKFTGVVWNYKSVKMPMYDDKNNLIDIEAAEQIPLTFDYDLLYNYRDLVTEENLPEFNAELGKILMDILENSLENDSIKYNTTHGDSDTQ